MAKTKKHEPKLKLGQLVRTADNKKVFSKVVQIGFTIHKR